MKRLLLLCLLQLLLSAGIYAQAPEPITIDLTQASLGTVTYPFDVPFMLKGTIPTNCTEIFFSYRVSLTDRRQRKSWISLPSRDNIDSFFNSGHWRAANADDKTFLLFCKGIHPNMKYEFQFQIIKDISGDAALKADLKLKLAARIKKFITDNALKQVFDDEFDALNDDLTEIIKAKLLTDTVNQHIVQRGAPLKEYNVDIRESLKETFNSMETQITTSAIDRTKFDGEESLAQTVVNIFTSLNKPSQKDSTLLDQVNGILAGKIPLTDASKAMLDVSITPSLSSFKGYTLRNGLLVLKKLCQTPELFSMVLNGKSMISNNDVAESPTWDGQSVDFLNALIRFLKEGNLVTTTNLALFKNLDTLQAKLSLLTKSVDEIVDATAKLATIIANFPDLTLEVLVNNSLRSDIVSLPDVLTTATPYISVDGGIGYSPAYQAAFSYYGANFYFSPVNKKARLSTFKGWNLIKKMLCGTVGVATVFGDRLPHTSALLGTGKSDLFVGLGVRTGRVVKFNFSCLPYKISDNPVTADKKLKLSFSAGLGIDINLLGALGKVGSALLITN